MIINTKSQIPNSLPETILIDTNGKEKEARRIVDALKGKKSQIGIYGHDDAFNRRIVETMKIKYLINPEVQTKEKRDTLKQRDSGINHVVAKEAAKKDISIIIDLDPLNKMRPKEKAIFLSRTIQNIKVCRRAKCEIRFLANDIDKKQFDAIGFSLGMSSQQVNDCILKV